MPFPIIPIVIGVGLVAVAGSGKKSGKAKGLYDRFGTHNNLWIPRSLAGFKQMGARADHLPFVAVSVAAGTTSEQEDVTGEILADRAEREPNVNFFWVPNFEWIQKFYEKQRPKPDIEGTAMDPNVGLRLAAVTSKGDAFVWPIAAGASATSTADFIDELTYYAATGDSSRLPQS